MFAPPSGYLDLLADAHRTPPRAPCEPITIPEVGVLAVRIPEPRSAAALAMTVNSKNDRETQVGYLNVFVREHLEDGGFEDLLVGMMRDELPAATMQLAAKAIATTGTARPYNAVASLAGLAGHHWRVIRAHLITHGIADPMGLGSLHALLDVVETMAIEATQSEKPAETRRKREQLLDALYRPDLTATTARPSGPPAGFDDDATQDSFDAFAKAVR